MSQNVIAAMDGTGKEYVLLHHLLHMKHRLLLMPFVKSFRQKKSSDERYIAKLES